jgi:hypothetical protein
VIACGPALRDTSWTVTIKDDLVDQTGETTPLWRSVRASESHAGRLLTETGLMLNGAWRELITLTLRE